MKRANHRGTQLARGFLLGMDYQRGRTLTTARIRKLGASRATAKRDMKVIRSLVPSAPSQPVAGMRVHLQQRTKELK